MRMPACGVPLCICKNINTVVYPVLREGRLVGIITDSDYVGVAINLLEQLEQIDPLETDTHDLEL